MEHPSSGVITVEQTPPNGCFQHLCPQEECQLTPAFWGEGSLKSASGCDTGFFPTTASMLGLEAREIFYTAVKIWLSVPPAPWLFSI